MVAEERSHGIFLHLVYIHPLVWVFDGKGAVEISRFILALI